MDLTDVAHHRGRRHVRVRDAREAEVEDLGAGVRDDNVRGLQVAVDDAALVRVVDGLADGDELAQALADLRRARLVAAEVLPRPGGERLAENQLHREEVLAVVRAARLVERRDVRVRKPGQRLGLPPEHPEVLVVDEVPAAHDLEGDLAGRVLLLGLVDDPHPALAELAEDAEAADLARELRMSRGRGRTRRVTIESQVSVGREAAGGVRRHEDGGVYDGRSAARFSALARTARGEPALPSGGLRRADAGRWPGRRRPRAESRGRTIPSPSSGNGAHP